MARSIFEASIRRDLQLVDEEGVECLPNSTIFEQLALMSIVASAIICLASSQKFNFSKWIFDSMGRNLDNVSGKSFMYPMFIQVLALEKTKTTQANEIYSLKRRVKKYERRNRLRTHKLKRLYKVGLTARVESLDNDESLGKDASKQERRIDDIDVDKDITLHTKPKAKGMVLKEPKPLKLKKKDQIRLDEEAALRLYAKLQAKFFEEQRLKREKAQQEQEANIAFIQEWDDVQSKINDDYEFTKRKLTDVEKATFFMQLLEKRRMINTGCSLPSKETSYLLPPKETSYSLPPKETSCFLPPEETSCSLPPEEALLLSCSSPQLF
nr:hypothetical protein [Tanacetum cinerariifolium]